VGISHAPRMPLISFCCAVRAGFAGIRLTLSSTYIGRKVLIFELTLMIE
jgi:hypothetical protein